MKYNLISNAIVVGRKMKNKRKSTVPIVSIYETEKFCNKKTKQKLFPCGVQNVLL